MSLEHPVRALNAEVARKIAAGEVIDRPNAIVRELLDNAIDSGADKITVEISGGGIEKIRVIDNGQGMTKEDLENCARPHSTSKISSEKDLLNLSTLGFRGEALASIAAVTRLSIISGGWKMRSSITENHIIEKAPFYEGIIVQAEGLFENYPARRVFLKREATEGTLCKNTFVEKTLPNPEIAFRFISDGNVKIDLPKGESLKERFLNGMEITEDKNLFYQVEGKSTLKDNEWSFKIIIGETGIHRSNKKDISIFVNGRKIQEYALVQAIEYGGLGYFPNGTFPVAAAFIEINPSLVDFNIHPAKKEVKFKDISSLHHGISSTLRAFFAEYTGRKTELTEKNAKIDKDETQNLFSYKELNKTPSSLWKNNAFSKNSYNSNQKSNNEAYKVLSVFQEKKDNEEKTYRSLREKFLVAEKTPYYRPEKKLFCDAKNDIEEERKSNTEKISSSMEKIIENYTKDKIVEEKTDDFHFLGSALGTFLIAEKNETLYMIDQHAAHERMIFDKIMEEHGKFQTLLIPYEIKTKDKKEDEYLESIKDELSKLGFNCENKGNGNWEFTSLNDRWKGSEEDLEHALFDKKVEPKDLIYSMAATTACKAAVKDGWKLLESTAEEIARGALALEDPHCPHGRPCYFSLTREELFRLVRRTE